MRQIVQATRAILARFVVVAVLAASCAPFAALAVSVRPPRLASGGGWQGVLRQGAVEARVRAECRHPGAAHPIEILLRGLRPHALYAFYLVNGSGVTRGLGAAPFQARAREDGSLAYRATMPYCPYDHEIRIRVKYHAPGADPVIVLDGYFAESDM